MKHILFGMLFAATSFSPVGAFAACYDYQVVPASLDCSGGVQGGSADFGTSCVEVQTKLVQVTVQCPVVASAGGGNSSSGSHNTIGSREDRDSRAGNQMSGGGGFGSPH